MVELFRKRESPVADQVEEALKEISIARRTVYVPDESTSEFDELPAIRHGDDRVSGEAALEAYLDYLRKLMRGWTPHSGDYCDTDDDGIIC